MTRRGGRNIKQKKKIKSEYMEKKTSFKTRNTNQRDSRKIRTGGKGKSRKKRRKGTLGQVPFAPLTKKSPRENYLKSAKKKREFQVRKNREKAVTDNSRSYLGRERKEVWENDPELPCEESRREREVENLKFHFQEGSFQE